MSTLLLTDRRNPECVISERTRAQTHLLTHFRAWRLDQELAAGISPDSSAPHSLRAQTLIGQTSCAELSLGIRRVIDQAKRPVSPSSFRIPICRRKVLQAESTLEKVADRLASGDPVDARGIAQIRLLLKDGCGPLYNRPQADDLQPALDAAIEALELQI